MIIDRRLFLKGLVGLGALSLFPFNIKSDIPYEMVLKDIWPDISRLVSSDLSESMLRMKVFNTIQEYNVQVSKPFTTYHGDSHYYRLISLVRYVGVTANTEQEGIRKLATALKETHQEFTIKGSLSPAVSLKLADGRYMCMSYLLVNDNPEQNFVDSPLWDNKMMVDSWYKRFNAKWDNFKYSFEMGGIAPTV